MAETYALTPAVWPPLVASVFATVMALYCWHRREVPAAKPLLCVFAFGTLYTLAGALGAAALTPATKMTWFKVGDAFALPAATAGTCFVLEYTYPGRWLTRRNLVLLALPPLVVAFLIFVNGGQFIWQAYVVGPSGLGAAGEAGAGGAVLTVYVLGLAVVNVTALLWLFTRSPQHRWPVALILAGQIASRAVFLAYVARQPWTPLVDPLIAVILIASATYAVALFGFRIFDPMPAARQAVFQQLPAGGVVFDARGRVLSLNPAAQTILGIAESGARGKTSGASWFPQVSCWPRCSEEANRFARSHRPSASPPICPTSRWGADRTPGNMRRCSRRSAISAACSWATCSCCPTSRTCIGRSDWPWRSSG